MWCSQYGTSCKDKNCPYKHLDEFPGCCDAILKHPTESWFGMCELEPNHKGNHKALNMEWQGKGKTIADAGDWYRARNLMMCHIRRIGEHTDTTLKGNINSFKC